MLINCPECNKVISDKAEICVSCGFPIKKYLNESVVNSISETTIICNHCGSDDIDSEGYCNACGMKVVGGYRKKEDAPEVIEAEGIYTICPECGFRNNPGAFTCVKCGHKYKMFEYEVMVEPKEKLCPNCDSNNIRAFIDEKVIIPKKVKQQTSFNLNPLKPFTVFNHKEKVVRKEVLSRKSKFICNNCGNVFE